MADNIKVKNIYYMLSYAYQSLREAGVDRFASEEFDNVHDLFAAILINGVGVQIKRGLHRDYISRTEAVGNLRGRICISESVKQQTMISKKMICAYDEFMEDTAHNQIIKCTMMILLRCGNVKPDNKKLLRRMLLYLSSVSEIMPDSIRWDALKYHRNNATYLMLINVCWLVLKGLLLTTDSGMHQLARWLNDEQMFRLYERFVLSYYQKEHPEYCPKAAYIAWDIPAETDLLYLPIMKSDITLTYGDKTLIIDTKWYGHTMQNNTRFENTTFISGNIYQIYTYVKNKDKGSTGNVAGILLYAKTDEKVTPDSDFIMGGNLISLKTLDLGRDWREITKQLESLCLWLVEDVE